MSASWSFTQNPDAMKSQYEEKGFFLIESFINARDIARITQVVDRFHDSWTKENEEFYRERAINSAYLTGKDHLVFSANMIHRGIYGNGRKALDILFCEAKTELLEFAGNDCLPDSDTLKKLDNPVTFLNTIAIRGQS